MSGYYAPNGRFLATESGKPLVGAKLYTYQAGTTTLQTTYQDSSLATPNTNPVITDSQGRALVLLDTSKSYDFVLKRSDDSVVWTAANILPVATSADLTTQVTTLNASIASEAATRATNDGTLQSQINAINARARGAVSFSNTISGGVTAPIEKYVSTGGTLASGGTAGIYDSTAGTFTANAAGMWLFKMSIQLNVVSSFITYYIRTASSSQSVFGECRNAGISGASINAMFALSAGETVVATAYFSGSSDQTTSRYITFQYLGS